jgi:hypothetical protein
MLPRIVASTTLSVALSCATLALAQVPAPDDQVPLPPLTLAPPLPPGQAELAQADALFIAAKQLQAAGKVADACPKFAESKRLAPGVGVSLHLADCYERLGRHASAQLEFLAAEELARQRDDKRAEVASVRAKELEPRVNHVVIDLPYAPPDASVRTQVELDGTSVPAKSWGVALPVDPGDHLVVVRATGTAPRLFVLRVDASNPSATLSSGGENLDLVFTNAASSAYLLQSVIVTIDGRREYYARPPADSPIRHERLPLGDHTIELDLRYQANGYGLLPYLRGYVFEVKSQHTITIAAGKRVAVKATAFDDGGVTKSLGDRLSVGWLEKAW